MRTEATSTAADVGGDVSARSVVSRPHAPVGKTSAIAMTNRPPAGGRHGTRAGRRDGVEIRSIRRAFRGPSGRTEDHLPRHMSHSAGPTRGLGSEKRLDDPGDPVARVADLWLPTPQPSGAGLEITMPQKIQRPPSRFAVTVPNFVSPACCTTTSRGRPRRRCPATQDPRTTCATVCVSRIGLGRNSSAA
jgi:hypothetical protein